MKEEILEFIHRRFPTDSNWTTGNCFYFALILNSRFLGRIYYEPILGHFLFKAEDGNFYDWNGLYEFDTSAAFDWEYYPDNLHASHIIRDCLM